MVYTSQGREILLHAGKNARKLGHSFVGSIHLLLAISQMPGQAGLLIRAAGLDPVTVEGQIRALYGSGTRLPLPQGYTDSTRRILHRAGREAGSLGKRRVEPLHMLLAMLRQEKSGAGELLTRAGADIQGLFTRALELACRTPASESRNTTEGTIVKLLEQFSEDLVRKAADMEPVIGRSREIDTVIGILCRKHKNNPALVGEPGVGKTAIAEGLAQRIVAGDVPFKLRGKEVYLLDLTALVAGTQFRGQFESP